MEKQMNIPQLPFPEFVGEWEKNDLGVPLRVRLSVPIFFSYLKKGFPLLSLTQNTKIKTIL
jgi:hypothetical protein